MAFLERSSVGRAADSYPACRWFDSIRSDQVYTPHLHDKTPITSQEGIWQQSGVFLYVIFVQRARHQHMYTLRMDSLYASVSAHPFGVAAIGCHYGAGRTVLKINESR